MSILGAMYSAVSGLFAQSNALGIISNNIANANTVGYKDATTDFSTFVTQSGSSTAYSPGGVTSSPLYNISQQGVPQAASSPTDLAISGGGFFVVNSNPTTSNGTYSFTRVGSFSVDANGNLVNSAGLYLQGQPLTAAQSQAIDAGETPQLNSTSLGALQTVNVDGYSGSSNATSNVSIVGANLPADDTATSPARTITVPVYDSQGIEHDMTLSFTRATTTATPSTETIPVSGMATGDTYTFTLGGNTYTTAGTSGSALSDVATALQSAFTTAGADYTVSASGGNLVITDPDGNSLTGGTLTASGSETIGSATVANGTPSALIPNTWNVSASIPNAGSTAITLSGSTVKFNSDGTLDAAGTTFSGLSIAWDPTVSGGTSPQSVSMNLGTDGTTTGLAQIGSTYDAGQLSQDGVKFGKFTGVTVGQNGVVTANFDNGMSKAIYIVPLATFSNPDGLTPESGNTYAQTPTSGTPQLNLAGTGAAGTIAPSELEGSTVDIANEFSNLIVTQNAYQANSKVITTSDQMLQDLMNVIQ